MADHSLKDSRKPRRRAPRTSLLFIASTVIVSLSIVSPIGAVTSSATGHAIPVSGESPRSGRSGCGSHNGSSLITATIGGHERSAIVHVPSGYTGSRKLPLVLNMHGSGATPTDQELFTGMNATSDSDRFIVVYPQAVIPDGSGYDWNVPGEPLVGGRAVPSGSPNDVSFLTDLVGIVGQRYCVNMSRVYATGFSGGARIASQLACDASMTFAAVAVVSGLRHPTPCKPERAVPILAIHGTADPIDPYEGHGEAYWTYSVPTSAHDWATQDRCAQTATVSHPANGVTLTQYGRCEASAIVEFYTISGEGHEWPGGPKLPRTLTAVLGPQSNAIDANTVIWSFFSAHPMS